MVRDTTLWTKQQIHHFMHHLVDLYSTIHRYIYINPGYTHTAVHFHNTSQCHSYSTTAWCGGRCSARLRGGGLLGLRNDGGGVFVWAVGAVYDAGFLRGFLLVPLPLHLPGMLLHGVRHNLVHHALCQHPILWRVRSGLHTQSMLGLALVWWKAGHCYTGLISVRYIWHIMWVYANVIAHRSDKGLSVICRSSGVDTMGLSGLTPNKKQSV